MKYRLLVLDIDGTVTNSQKQVTEKTRNAILDLQKRGIPVAIASGRPPQGVHSIAKTLEFDKFGSYIMPFNGAKLLILKLWSAFIPRHFHYIFLQDCIRTH